MYLVKTLYSLAKCNLIKRNLIVKSRKTTNIKYILNLKYVLIDIKRIIDNSFRVLSEKITHSQSAKSIILLKILCILCSLWKVSFRIAMNLYFRPLRGGRRADLSVKNL